MGWFQYTSTPPPSLSNNNGERQQQQLDGENETPKTSIDPVDQRTGVIKEQVFVANSELSTLSDAVKLAMLDATQEINEGNSVQIQEDDASTQPIHQSSNCCILPSLELIKMSSSSCIDSNNNDKNNNCSSPNETLNGQNVALNPSQDSIMAIQGNNQVCENENENENENELVPSSVPLNRNDWMFPVLSTPAAISAVECKKSDDNTHTVVDVASFSTPSLLIMSSNQLTSKSEPEITKNDEKSKDVIPNSKPEKETHSLKSLNSLMKDEKRQLLLDNGKKSLIDKFTVISVTPLKVHSSEIKESIKEPIQSTPEKAHPSITNNAIHESSPFVPSSNPKSANKSAPSCSNAKSLNQDVELSPGLPNCTLEASLEPTQLFEESDSDPETNSKEIPTSNSGRHAGKISTLLRSNPKVLDLLLKRTSALSSPLGRKANENDINANNQIMSSLAQENRENSNVAVQCNKAVKNEAPKEAEKSHNKVAEAMVSEITLQEKVNKACEDQGDGVISVKGRRESRQSNRRISYYESSTEDEHIVDVALNEEGSASEASTTLEDCEIRSKCQRGHGSKDNNVREKTRVTPMKKGKVPATSRNKRKKLSEPTAAASSQDIPTPTCKRVRVSLPQEDRKKYQQENTLSFLSPLSKGTNPTLQSGSRVLCRWNKDKNFYPATIVRCPSEPCAVGQRKLFVVFDDGGGFEALLDDLRPLVLKAGDEILAYLTRRQSSNALVKADEFTPVLIKEIFGNHNVFEVVPSIGSNGSRKTGSPIDRNVVFYVPSSDIACTPSAIAKFDREGRSYDRETNNLLEQNALGGELVLSRELFKQKSLFRDFKFILSLNSKGSAVSANQKFLENCSSEEIKEKIEEREGSILEMGDLSKLARIEGKRVFLLANEPRRTMKYLVALAAGIPRVSVAWINECFKQDEIIDWRSFELSNGLSKITGCFMSSHSKGSRERIHLGDSESSDNDDDSNCEDKVFQGCEFFIYGKKPAFRENWSIPLRFGGALFVSEVSDFSALTNNGKYKKKRESSTLIPLALCECVPPKRIMDSILSAGARAINTEWVIQSLIHQNQAPFIDDFSVF